MWKKIETILIVIAVLIGLSWGGFEVWIRKFANGDQLEAKGFEYLEKKEYFKAKLMARLAIKAGQKEAKLLLVVINIKLKNPHDTLYWLEKAKDVKVESKKYVHLIINNQLRRYDKALKIFSKYNSADKNNCLNFFKAGVMEKLYNPDEAIRDCKNLAENDNKKVYSYLALLLFAKEDNINAIKWFKKAAENNDTWSISTLEKYYPEEKRN